MTEVVAGHLDLWGGVACRPRNGPPQIEQLEGVSVSERLNPAKDPNSVDWGNLVSFQS